MTLQYRCRLSFQAMHDTLFWYARNRDSDRYFQIIHEEASESYLRRFCGKTQILDKKTRTRKIMFDDETKGMPLRDTWEISVLAGSKAERRGFPAQKLGRRWIACDINKDAIQTTAKELQNLMQEQVSAAAGEKQGKLIQEDNAPPKPAQLSFTTWRVNDYDLQIQHKEAVGLACEHIGVTRTRADSYFDGVLGSRLVKIVPFNHPLTPLDLEDLKSELARRPEESRDVTMVCLGIELAARAWVESHNPGHDPSTRCTSSTCVPTRATVV